MLSRLLAGAVAAGFLIALWLPDRTRALRSRFAENCSASLLHTSGVVLRPDGTPAAGANVYWIAPEGENPRIRKALIADDGGHFEAEFWSVGTPSERLKVGWLLARAPGCGLTGIPLDGPTDGRTIALRPTTSVSVTLRGPDGAPLAGRLIAPIRLWHGGKVLTLTDDIGTLRRSPELQAILGESLGVTDDYGTAELGGLPARSTAALIAEGAPPSGWSIRLTELPVHLVDLKTRAAPDADAARRDFPPDAER